MGALYSVGYHGYYGLGNGISGVSITTVTQAGVVDTWTHVSSNDNGAANCSLLVKSDGTLWSFGKSSSRLGLGSATPGNFTSPQQIGTDTDWAKVSAGRYSSLAIKTDGTLWGWGNNTYGEIGIGSTTAQNSPVQVGFSTQWAKVYCGEDFSAAIKTDGTLWAWGRNNSGKLGQGTVNGTYYTPVQVGGATNWIACHLCGSSLLALNSAGEVWGAGSVTPLGINDAVGYESSLIQAIAVEPYTKIGGGFTHTLLLGASGKLYATGSGSSGVLGQGNTTTYYVPTQVGTEMDWTGVASSCGSVSVAKNSTGVMAWGNNSYQQSGANSATNPLTTPTSTTWPADIAVAGYSLAGVSGVLLEIVELTPETLSLPFTIVVGERGSITTPVTIEVQDTGTISSTLTIRVSETSTISTPVTINVFSPTVFSETATIPAPVGAVPAWSVLVMLDGEDVSASLYGTVSVDAEEDASRVATFYLALSGEFNPTAKNRKPVTLDYQLSGTTWRIFTGRVDATVIDLQNRAIRFDCTDLRADVLDGASQAQTNALTPTAYHSRILYGKATTGRDYLRQRMVSYAGNLDLDALGKLRVVSWSEGAVIKTHTAADVFDGSVSVNVSNASGAGAGRNEVIIESRTQRLHSARMTVNWLANTDVLYYQPTREVITDALADLDEGWQAETSLISIDQGTNPETAVALSTTLVNRWVQDVTTTTTYTLRAAGVEPDAPIVRSNRVGIETKYVESAWVDDERVEQDTEPGSDLEEEQQKAIRCALNATRKDILAAHRAHRVEYDIPLDPTIDLHNVYRLTTDSIDAAGQCARVQHVMDIDKGEVTTRISIALYGAAAVAPDVADDTPLEPGYGESSDVSVEIIITPPVMTNQIVIQPLTGGLASPDWDLSGWACEVHTYVSGVTRSEVLETDWWYGRLRDVGGNIINYREAAEVAYDIAKSQFRIDVPAISAELTDEEVVEVEENQIIAVPASLFTITF